MSNVVPFPTHRVARVDDASAPVERLWREAVGESLRAARHEHDERIVDTAERAGVSPQYLSEVERGLKDPSSEVLAALCGALDLTVQQVIGDAGSRLSGPVCLAA